MRIGAQVFKTAAVDKIADFLVKHVGGNQALGRKIPFRAQIKVVRVIGFQTRIAAGAGAAAVVNPADGFCLGKIGQIRAGQGAGISRADDDFIADIITRGQIGQKTVIGIWNTAPE